MDILFAYVLFLEIKNNPPIIGNKNTTLNQSNLIWYENDVKPIIKSLKSNPSNIDGLSPMAKYAPLLTIPNKILIMTILFFFWIFEFNTKNIVNGKNTTTIGFEKIANT